MPIPPEKIIEAATKAGFDAELRAASALSEAGWSVNQNVYYIDKDENKGRELDIEAYKIFLDTGEKPEVNCHLNFLIEVKKTAEPFIFFTNTAGHYENGSGFSLLHWSHKVSNKVLPYREIERHRPLAAPARFARSYCAFKDSKTQQILSGLLSAVKAATHYREQCNEQYSKESHDIAFFLPLLVVDGPLYECFLKPGSSTLHAEPTDRLVYMQNYHSPSYGRISSRVTVITAAALPNYLEDCSRWGEHMLKVMKGNRYIT